MSDWDPFWSASPPPSPKAAPRVASPSSTKAAPRVASPSSDKAPSEVAASSQDESSLTRELKSLNQCIEQYLRLLGLDDLARQFLEKAEKVEGLPPVQFVETWIDASIKSATFRHSYPRNDRETAAIASLNEGLAAYLKYLEIDLECFNAKASPIVVRNGSLIHLWIAVVYPRLV